MEIGVHLWPWHPMPELLGYAERAVEVYPFDQIWLVDAHQYEDAFTALAAREADGVILTQINPWTSLAGMREGRFRRALDTLEAALPVSKKMGFKKIYSAKISVSQDGAAAKQWAKRQVSYGAATYPAMLKKLGFDPLAVENIKAAYTEGHGLEEAAARVSDELASRLGFVVGGTPSECIAGYEEILHHLKGLGFSHLVMGVPLGPNVSEALELIGKKGLPALRSSLN
jgi:hypothetical protein